MTKYTINKIQCELSAIGLCTDTVNAEVEFIDEKKKHFFLSAVEFEGCPNIYKTEKSIFSYLLNDGIDVDKNHTKLTREQKEQLSISFFDELNEKNSIYSDESYSSFYEDLNSCGKLHEAVRFLIYIVRSSWNEIECCKKNFVGKSLDQIDIPKCDAELAYDQGLELGEEDEDSLIEL